MLLNEQFKSNTAAKAFALLRLLTPGPRCPKFPIGVWQTGLEMLVPAEGGLLTVGRSPPLSSCDPSQLQ